jgi:hypothetical protein
VGGLQLATFGQFLSKRFLWPSCIQSQPPASPVPGFLCAMQVWSNWTQIQMVTEDSWVINRWGWETSCVLTLWN